MWSSKLMGTMTIIGQMLRKIISFSCMDVDARKTNKEKSTFFVFKLICCLTGL